MVIKKYKSKKNLQGGKKKSKRKLKLKKNKNRSRKKSKKKKSKKKKKYWRGGSLKKIGGANTIHFTPDNWKNHEIVTDEMVNDLKNKFNVGLDYGMEPYIYDEIKNDFFAGEDILSDFINSFRELMGDGEKIIVSDYIVSHRIVWRIVKMENDLPVYIKIITSELNGDDPIERTYLFFPEFYDNSELEILNDHEFVGTTTD